ncbi:MAG TPA: hypothetical protein VFP87_13805, partial [Chitinophagaceae bacterium]|nr:hypothetical protein [Chitinophagaceae bacterium]
METSQDDKNNQTIAANQSASQGQPTGEEHEGATSTPAKVLKGNSDEQTTPEEKVESIKPQRGTMEVHKHPQHVLHKKKWTEYLLEFFMIFFAVTMGFYAENIRERVSDSEREKDYMRSMIEDLRQDTASCHRVINQNATIVRGLDTLISYILKSSEDKDNINLIYAYCIKYRYYNPEVQFSERTMAQLKNNGGLRLVKKREVSDALSSYDQGIRFCDRQRDQVLHYYGVLDETELTLFDFGPIKPLWDSLFNVDVLSVPIPTMVHSIAGKV